MKLTDYICRRGVL